MAYLHFQNTVLPGKFYALGQLIDQGRLPLDTDLANWYIRRTNHFRVGCGSEESRAFRTALFRILAAVYSHWEGLEGIVGVKLLSEVVEECKRMIEVSRSVRVVVWELNTDPIRSRFVERHQTGPLSPDVLEAYLDLPHMKQALTDEGYWDGKGSQETKSEKALKLAIAEFNKRRKLRRHRRP
jgi:hypothetical protein